MPCLRLCRFFGNPETHNLCSQCYRDYRKEVEAFMLAFKKKKEALAAEAAAASTTNTFTSCEDDDATSTITKKINRCNSCKKKVVLTGFSCRCGGMFCGLHRYPEEHACYFDFKKQARLALPKQNPLCTADKLNYRL
ncbi:hypothetical protein ACH5RR_017029 [Cinchona calisaya]|uniref:Uncharacterized protein n=1 Tax=Cinchona calisaya TaxID=153742 RepID=A0ABD2ZXL4_9GENT